MIRREILQEAEKCVCTDRNDQYGSPENNFALIAKYWNLYLGEPYKVTAENVGMMLALMKVARIQTGKFKMDSWIDACGYMAISGEISQEGGQN